MKVFYVLDQAIVDLVNNNENDNNKYRLIILKMEAMVLKQY